MKEKKEPKKRRQRRRIEILGIDDWDDIKVDGAESTDSTDDADLPGIDPDPKEQDEAAAADESTDVDEAADADATADVTNADTADAANDADDDGLDGYAKAARALLANLAADAAAADAADNAADDATTDTANAQGTVSATDGDLPPLDPDIQDVLDQIIAHDKLDFTDVIGGCCFDHSKKGGNTMNVKDLGFYNALGAAALDFDRGMPMNSDLRDWIMAAIVADEELATDSLQRLGELLENHPKLTGAVRAIVDKVEENSVPYFAAWRSKIDGKLYVCRETAERAIDRLVKSGVTEFDKVYSVEYCRHTDEEPGYLIVEDSEVVDFLTNYKGDREKLMKKLFIPTTPKPQQDSAKGDKPDDKKSDKKDDKKDNKKSDKDQAKPKA